MVKTSFERPLDHELRPGLFVLTMYVDLFYSGKEGRKYYLPLLWQVWYCIVFSRRLHPCSRPLCRSSPASLTPPRDLVLLVSLDPGLAAAGQVNVGELGSWAPLLMLCWSFEGFLVYE